MSGEVLGGDFAGELVEVVAAVNPFFVIIAVSLIPTFLFQVLRQFSEALGRPWQPMIILFFSVGLNAFFNWVLIFGHWGFPRMGIAGAGWATVLSSLLTPLLLLGVYFGPRLRRAGRQGRYRPIDLPQG